jgi:hypothetical protein
LFGALEKGGSVSLEAEDGKIVLKYSAAPPVPKAPAPKLLN